MKSFRETEAVSLEHGLDDAERFEKWGKARWMLLDEVNQWVVALRWGNHRSLAGVEHQEGHGGFREVGVASEWPER